MKEQDLANAISDWFNSNESNQTKWYKSPVGRAIKSQLQQWGYWRNKRRGAPTLRNLKPLKTSKAILTDALSQIKPKRGFWD